MSGHRPWSEITHKASSGGGDESGEVGTDQTAGVAPAEDAPARHRKKRKLPKVIPAAEVERIFQYVAADPKCTPDERARNHLALLLMYSAGLRVSEVVALRPRDIEMDGVIRVYDAKGGDGTSYFNPEWIEPALEAWLRIRQAWLSPMESTTLDGWPLFLMPTGTPMNTRYLQRLVKRVRETLGIALQVTPHTFRHTFATESLEDGMSLAEVSSLLRHAHLQTTAVYLHVRDESLRRKMSQRQRRR